MDHHREVHECRCPGVLLELLPAEVAVGLAFLLVFRFPGVFLPRFGGRVRIPHCCPCRLGLVGRLGAFLPPVVLASGGSRYDGDGWAGERGGNRVGHHILSHSGDFQRSARVQAITLRAGAVTGQPSLSSLARGDKFRLHILCGFCRRVGGGEGGVASFSRLSPVPPLGSPVPPWRWGWGWGVFSCSSIPLREECSL